VTPETLHSLRREETTHMNSRTTIIARIGVPLSTGPSSILFDVWFHFILLRTHIQGGLKKVSHCQIIKKLC